MVEIELSFIEDEPDRIEVMNQLLQEFRDQHEILVHLNLMSWEQAWQDLFSFTLKGKGPDVSHVGSTWTSSLVEMNALRPFTNAEVAQMGGVEAYIPADWQSVTLAGDPRTWAIPWYSYIYLIAYRRDMLKSAGIDEQTAFGSIDKLTDTVKRLQAAGVETPVAMPVQPDNDLSHMVASWVWDAGGDFISEDGKKILFSQPAALAGMKSYFSLLSSLPSHVRGLGYTECFNMFSEGQAAIIFTNCDSIQTLARDTEVRDQVATAIPTTVPWFGGGNLIIWRHTRENPERERASLALVSYLTSRTVQAKRAHMDGTLPARVDALPELKLHPPSLGKTLEEAVKIGRPYRTVPLWRRIEYQLGQELTHIQLEITANPGADLDELLHSHIEPLARRMSLLIG